jgi:hypothetical protein
VQRLVIAPLRSHDILLVTRVLEYLWGQKDLKNFVNKFVRASKWPLRTDHELPRSGSQSISMRRLVVHTSNSTVRNLPSSSGDDSTKLCDQELDGARGPLGKNRVAKAAEEDRNIAARWKVWDERA